MQYTLALGSQATISVLAADFNGNFDDAPFSWTFGVQESSCGQAEFYDLETSSLAAPLVINSATPMTDGRVTVTAYNPSHKELSWVQNTRIKNITLMYRASGSSKLQPALDVNGSPAEFFDDV